MKTGGETSGGPEPMEIGMMKGGTLSKEEYQSFAPKMLVSIVGSLTQITWRVTVH